jgi:hypothetical protein
MPPDPEPTGKYCRKEIEYSSKFARHAGLISCKKPDGTPAFAP